MSSSPKISVIIPVYNASAFLAEALDSVLAQTLTNLEVICVNDGSSDQSGDILAAYANKDSRLRVISQANAGASAARNLGLDLASGEYVYFADADDRLASDLCEKAIAVAEPNQLDFVFVFERPAIKFGFGVNAVFNQAGAVDKERFMLNNTAALWQKVYSRRFLIENDLRLDPHLRVAEDQHLHFRAMALSDSFGVVAEELYFYRKHSGSLTRSAVATSKAFDIFDVHRQLRDFLATRNLLNEFGDALFFQMLKQEFRLYCLLNRENRSVWQNRFAGILTAHELAFLKKRELPILHGLFFRSITASNQFSKMPAFVIAAGMRYAWQFKNKLLRRC